MDIRGFKSQQYRWAKGSIQTARKLLPRILAAPLPWRAKLEGFIHLTNNCAYLLMVLLSVLIFPAMVLRRGANAFTLLVVDLPLFLGATLSVLAFYIASQVASREDWRRQLRVLPALMGLGIGLSINNARAVFSGFFRRGGIFHRTPKYRIEKRRQDWRRKRYRARWDPSCLVEGLLAVYFAFCCLHALQVGMWLSLPFLYLFLQGYTFIFLSSALRGWGKGILGKRQQALSGA